MNTATLTFHASNNNGSFLQAYALQRILQNQMGINNDIIDLQIDKQLHQYSVFRKPKCAGDLLRNSISMLHYKELSSRFIAFDEMRHRHLQMTEECRTESQAYDVARKYDVIICGSDQIWNIGARDFSEIYFLPRLKNKKITYGVSCGYCVHKEGLLKYIDDVSKFNHISVREHSIASTLENAGVSDVTVVLDPTLLLDRKEYEILYTKERVLCDDYIFLYTINYSDEVLKSVKKLALKYNLPVYTAFTGYSAVKCYGYGIKVLYDVAPDKFLNLIHHAAYICTNSFHGIAFSILYKKDFFRPCAIDAYGQLISDDRIDGILNILRIKNRNISTDYVEVLPLNYAEITTRLKELQSYSISYLARALETAGVTNRE